MWFGSAIGRLLARVFKGRLVEQSLPDAAVQLWLVRRLVPKWAIGQAWGNVILLHESGWDTPDTEALLLHEYRHVLQWRRFGNVFLVIYPLCSLWAGVRHGPRMAYWMNRFEREARGECEAKGRSRRRHRSPVESDTKER